MENVLQPLRELNAASMTLRIVLAMLVGGVLGFEREFKRRPAGFRTYMLVAMGAAVTMILGQYLDLMLSTAWAADYEAVGRRTDVVRLGARVVSGIGFLGTGTILVTARHQVRGLTTASSLWAAACMGLAIGAGFYECVAVAFALVLLCLRLLPPIENAARARARNMNVYIELDSVENIGGLIGRMKEAGLTLYDVELNREQRGRAAQVNVLFSLRLPPRRQHAEVLAKLSTFEGVAAIEEV